MYVRGVALMLHHVRLLHYRSEKISKTTTAPLGLGGKRGDSPNQARFSHAQAAFSHRTPPSPADHRWVFLFPRDQRVRSIRLPPRCRIPVSRTVELPAAPLRLSRDTQVFCGPGETPPQLITLSRPLGDVRTNAPSALVSGELLVLG